MKRSIPGLAILAACLFNPSAALACRCGVKGPAGFVHADVTRLPSNARGALFLQPSGLKPIAEPEPGVTIYAGVPRTITAQSFSITADGGQRKLLAQLTWLDMFGNGHVAPPRALRFARQADQARVSAGKMGSWRELLKSGVLVDISASLGKAQQVLRVGPVDGFKPGTRYTITYLGKSENWAYPSAVVHEIDALPAVPGKAYQLVLDGPPARRQLQFPAGDGSCARLVPSIVQNFHYVVPISHQPYRKAVVYYSEVSKDQFGTSALAAFSGIDYRAYNCAGDQFGKTALGNGVDLVPARCVPNAGSARIRGWAGLLEVDDRLQLTNVARVDFEKASGSCAHASMRAPD